MSAPIRFERQRATPISRMLWVVVWAAWVVALIELPLWWSGRSTSGLASVTHHTSVGFVPRGHPIHEFVTPADLELFYTAATTSEAALARVLGVLLLAAMTGVGMQAAMARLGGRMSWRREQQGVLLWLSVGLLWIRVCLLWAPLAATWIPIAAVLLPVALQLGRRVCLACALVVALVVGAMVPTFDTVLALTAMAQGVVLGVWVPRHRRGGWRWAAPVVVACGLGSVLGYLAGTLLVHGGLLPLDLVSMEWGRLGWAAIGGLCWPVVGLALDPLLERLVGNVSRTTLLELADLSHPALQRISTRAPGTWAHSRAMANLAESAAHAVGADALLVRVGAYYHDLGKADEPQYFIENLPRGRISPHDQLAPGTSADKIIHHVRSSVVRGRAAGLPEPVIDFMHTHHGDGRVEYFYQQARAAAEDPETIDPGRFTYPGERPFSPETGILMIVDSVEAASRTLDEPTLKQVDNLLRQIVFSKLVSGQLDDSGLSVGDLRRIVANLSESLLAAAHDRITYPWQEEEKAAARAETGMTEPSGIVDIELE